MRLIMESRLALLGAVSLALALLLGLAFASRSAGIGIGVSEPGTFRPERATRVCPAPHETAGHGAESTVAAFAPRVGRDDTGRLWAVPVPGGGDASALGEERTEPGGVWRADTGQALRPTALRAEGALAAGLDSAQTTVSDTGVTEVRCEEPSTDLWFALPGGTDPEAVEVASLTAHLANPTETRTTVSVDLYTQNGPAYSAESRGIPLPAGASTELDLTGLAQETAALGVHVRTSTGRVAASLLAEHSSGATGWVPPTRAPAEEHVIPGVPGGDGSRRLLVAAPGDEPVEARVRLLPEGADGEGEPLVVHVPPAASAWLTLESGLRGRTGTVVVEADAPVVAGVHSEYTEYAEDGSATVLDTAYAAAVEPLSAPLDTTAVIPDVPGGVAAEVAMAALDGEAHVVVTPIGADGTQGDAVRVDLAPGTTHVFGSGAGGWTAPAAAGGYALRLELLEGSGPVYAARRLSTPEGWSVLPVHPAPVEVELPVVRDTMVGVVP
ncbi:DUF5719 family protein [Nocardiopsis sp. LOL_012]|uniref:DUF5719 family protein n=1 Tax=Nocardiopsis sp. LOL_012 TaxID=3345409 RepID=UPI003A857B16